MTPVKIFVHTHSPLLIPISQRAVRALSLALREAGLLHYEERRYTFIAYFQAIFIEPNFG